jgi:hypothetical protein
MGNEKHAREHLPRIKEPHLKLIVRHVDGIDKEKHRRTFFAARQELVRMRALRASAREQPDARERPLNEKLHVAIAVKLKGAPDLIVVRNDQERHAEEVLAAELLRLHQHYIRTGRTLPRIASLSIVAEDARNPDHEVELPEVLHVHDMPRGVPCMCGKCIYYLDRVLAHDIYPRPERSAEDSEKQFEKRLQRWRRTLKFPIQIGLNETMVVKTNFQTVPLLRFKGSHRAKPGRDILSLRA